MKYRVKDGINKGAKYAQTVGLIGEQFSVVRGCKIALVFEDVKNPDSNYGCFYYEKSELEIIREEDVMNKKFYLEEGYKVARVKFLDGYNDKLYSFAVYDENAFVDYLAVTDTNKLVEIREILDLEQCQDRGIMLPTAQIKAVIDDRAFLDRVARANKKAELKKKMDERVKQLQTEQIYELFAEKDSALKDLLDEFKTI